MLINSLLTNPVRQVTALLQQHPMGRLVLVLALVILALALRPLLHWLIDWAMRRNAASTRTLRTVGLDVRDEQLLHTRREKRAATLGAVFKVIVTFILVDWCIIESFSIVGLDLQHAATSAGFIGLAIAFGAQSFIKDVLAGLAIVLEDQFEIGDVVETGSVQGTVLAIQLRTTTIRDSSGVVWHVRNSTISSVGNLSQSFSLAVIDLPIARTADLQHALEILRTAVAEFVNDELVSHLIVGEPQLLGVEVVDAFHITIRLNIKALPGQNHVVRREFNSHLHKAMRDAGIPTPHSTPFWKSSND